MKHGLKRTAGFTLIELLVVIAIIAILAGMLLPAINKAAISAKIKKTAMEIKNIEGAIGQYQSTYSRYPTSKDTRKFGIDQGTGNFPDFTFGTKGTGPVTAPHQFVNKHATIKGQVLVGRSGYETNNAEVMAILMDIKEWTPTKTSGNGENPQHQSLLSPTAVDQKTKGGLGPDGVYRDLWGNPYIISFDMNYDNQTRDAFYKKTAVSKINGKPMAGFIEQTGAPADSLDFRGGVMVWSAGPDGNVDETKPANESLNKDNIVSWK